MKKSSRRVSRPAAALLAGLLALPAAAAAQQPASAPEVVVTATRLPTDIEQVGSSVTVIAADDIERRQLRTIVDVLRAVPGLHVVQLGPAGQQASVFARGANSNQTLVLIDGLEAGNPSASNGAFNFAHLVPDNIERIEVVRGPQSTLYGSDAIGGVINIITKRGAGRPSLSARIEGGSNATWNPSASASGTLGGIGFATTASFYKTDGESVTAARVRPAGVGAEDDGYENFMASARLDGALTDRVETSLIGRFLRADSETDPTAEDPNARIIERQMFLRWRTAGRFFGERWEPSVALNLTRYRQFPSNDPDALTSTVRRTENTGQKLKAEFQNDVHVADDNTLTLGAEAETELLRQTTRTDFPAFSFVITGQSDDNVDNRALYLQDRFTLFGRLSGTLGLRHDDHQSFGGKTTWRSTLVYRHAETATRLKASYGTGFRAPALFELFGRTANNFGGAFNGNPNLRPEESRGWEAGFEQALFDGRARFGATWFQSRIDDLIVCSITTCSNTSNARIRGVEAFAAGDITRTLSARLDYTYTRAEDGDTRTDLLRRPKHKADLDVTWRPRDDTRLTLGIAAVAAQRDVDFQTGGDALTPGHVLVNLAGSYDVNETVTAFARARNLFDKDYEVADGFRGTGLNVLVGLSARF